MLLNVAVCLALAPAAVPVRNVVAVPPPRAVPRAPGSRVLSAAFEPGAPRSEVKVLCGPCWPVRPLPAMGVQPDQSVVPLGTASFGPCPIIESDGLDGLGA